MRNQEKLATLYEPGTYATTRLLHNLSIIIHQAIKPLEKISILEEQLPGN